LLNLINSVLLSIASASTGLGFITFTFLLF
jgi:hypothetical protein